MKRRGNREKTGGMSKTKDAGARLYCWGRQRPLEAPQCKGYPPDHTGVNEGQHYSTQNHTAVTVSSFLGGETGHRGCVCVCVRAHAGVCVSYRAHSKDSLNDGEHQVEQPDADHSVKQGAESGSAGGR